MFERYTEAARRVIFYSRYMAAESGSPEIETEYLLLGLLRADMVLAQRFLGSPWAAEQVWREVENKTSARPPIPPGIDLKLSPEAKHVLRLAADEAEQLSSKTIRTEHLLLGLLCEEGCFAAELLHRRGVQSASTRDELVRNPHDDSTKQTFVRELGPRPQEVVECQTRIRAIMSRMRDAIANHDFATPRLCAVEERAERDNLRLLCQQHGLSDWIFE